MSPCGRRRLRLGSGTSGRSETRPMLTEDEIRTNADTYLAQAGR